MVVDPVTDYLARIGRKGSTVSAPAKAKAARLNGQKLRGAKARTEVERLAERYGHIVKLGERRIEIVSPTGLTFAGQEPSWRRMLPRYLKHLSGSARHPDKAPLHAIGSELHKIYTPRLLTDAPKLPQPDYVKEGR